MDERRGWVFATTEDEEEGEGECWRGGVARSRGFVMAKDVDREDVWRRDVPLVTFVRSTGNTLNATKLTIWRASYELRTVFRVAHGLPLA